MTGVEKGQKLQLTVRFEPETMSTIELIQKDTGVSLAETVRRIVKKGIKQYLKEKQEAEFEDEKTVKDKIRERN